LIVPVALCKITIYNIHNVNGLPRYSTESYWYYQSGNPLTLYILYIVILQRATGTINVAITLIVPVALCRITIYNIHNVNGLIH
jgi:hypothetical protein